MKWMEMLIKTPTHLCTIGWALFPSMYLLTGILSSLRVPLDTAFFISAPLGIMACIFWLLALIFSVKSIIAGSQLLTSWLVAILSLIPFIFFAMLLWLMPALGS